MAELEREAHFLGQHGDEVLQALEVEMEVCLQLEEDGSELVVKPECRIHDQVDRLLFDREPLDVGDVAAAFDRKRKAWRRLLSPGLEALPWRLPIEGVVELDRVEVLRVEREVLSRRHLVRVEHLPPVRVRPARTTDTDIPRHSSAILRKIAAIRR